MFEVECSVLVTLLIREFLIYFKLVAEGYALLFGVFVLVCVLAVLKWFLAEVREAVWGTKFISLAFYFFLFIVLSGDGIGGVPSPSTIGIMSAAIVGGLFITCYYRQIQIYIRSVWFSIIISFALVYSTEYLFPWTVRLLENEFVLIRHIEHDYGVSGPTPDDNLQNTARDLVLITSCHTVMECAIRWTIILFLSIVLSIMTFQTNYVSERTRVALEQITAEEKEEKTKLNNSSSV
jgi:hypothetical protein